MRADLKISLADAANDVTGSGLTIARRFEVERLVAGTVRSRVYRARDRRDGSSVAVKLSQLPPAAARSFTATEASALKRLGHVGVAGYVSSALRSATPYLVTQWCDGPDLFDLLGAPQSTSFTLVLAQRLASTLRLIHGEEIVHNDVKPENILLPSGQPAKAVLIDFEFAAADSSYSTGGVVYGTRDYMAPERFTGSLVDSQSDVFALGCVLFECLTGARWRVEAGSSGLLAGQSRDRPKLRQGLARLIADMLLPSPWHRPTMFDVAMAVDRLVARI